MKHYFFLFFILVLISFFVCLDHSPKDPIERQQEEKRGIFISYIELNRYLKGKEVTASKKAIDSMIDDIYQLGFNMIILQVRSFSDAIYPSSIYPWSSTVSFSEGVDPGYDILAYFLKRVHQRKMLLYAWINPYRVRTDINIDSITEGNPAYPYIGTDTLWVQNGIYYNPSKQVVEDLIVRGVEELVQNYAVDGILFDDYFYPSQEIDTTDYELYLTQNEYLSLVDYHLMIVNRMVERVHQVCQKHKVLFGISPDGNISNNYNTLSADVKSWVQSDRYLDFIMPQIYYGFYNETKAFKGVIDEWSDMITSDKVDFMIALAFYKVGLVDTYAKSGSLEWVQNNDIIMREIILSRNVKQYKGFSLFRYDYLVNTELQTNTTMKEIENMKKVLK